MVGYQMGFFADVGPLTVFVSHQVSFFPLPSKYRFFAS